MNKHNLVYYGLIFILIPFWYVITEVLTYTKLHWYLFGLVLIAIGAEKLGFAFDD